MNLFTITGEIVLRGKDTVEKQLLNLSGTTNNVTNQMEKYFNRLGGVILTAFSVKALVNFTKQLAQTSATVHEELAQFEAVLGDLQDKMNEGIQRVSKNTGILETRLRKTSTAVFAMFKGAEVEVETALTNTERFLQLASDASAFYDKSMEEVQGDLQSFMRGITRAGYGIGLYTSELQRNEKALEMFDTTYDKLGQAERYEVMLNIIEQTYKLAGVTGQAQRESEQWLNVTSNLKEAWKQFMASAGTRINQALLKPMKSITQQLLVWKERLDVFNKWWEDNGEEVGKAIDGVRDKFLMLALAIGGTVTALSVLGIAKKAIGALVENWSLVAMTGLALVAMELIKLWNENEELRSQMTEVWQGIKDDVTPIINAFTDLFEVLIETGKIVWSDVFAPIVDYIIKNKDTLLNITTSVINAITSMISNINNFLDKLNLGPLKILTIGFTLEYVGKELIPLLTPIFTGVAGLGLNKTGVTFALLSIGVQLVEAMTDKNYTNFINNLIAGLALGLGVGILTHNASLGMLVMTISVNFKLGETISDFANRNADAWKLEDDEIDYDSLYNKYRNLRKQGRTQQQALSQMQKLGDIPDDVMESFKSRYSAKLKDYPKLATGGLVTNETFATIGEAGNEAILPLTDSNAMSAIATAIVNEMKNVFDFSSLNLGSAVSTIWNEIQATPIFQRIAGLLGFDVQSTGGSGTGSNNGGSGTGSGEETKDPSFWDKLKEKAKNFYESIFKQNKDWEKRIGEVFSKMHDAFENITDYVESYISPLFDSIAELQDQRSQQEIDRLEADLESMKEQHETENELAEESYNQQLKDLYHMLDIGLMSYEDYTDSVEKLNADMEADKQAKLDEEALAEQELLKKKDDLARKQFESQKATSIAMVWVNTAQAIMKAFSELGVIGGAVATALLLATAGVQTALIAEQKYEPMLATGGVIDRPTRAIIGEDGAEAVVPLERNLGWVNGLATALEPTINANNIDYTPEIHTISEQLDEMKQLLANFLPMFAQQQITLDGAVVGRKIAPYIDGSFGIRQRYAYRGI